MLTVMEYPYVIHIPNVSSVSSPQLTLLFTFSVIHVAQMPAKNREQYVHHRALPNIFELRFQCRGTCMNARFE